MRRDFEVRRNFKEVRYVSCLVFLMCIRGGGVDRLHHMERGISGPLLGAELYNA
ncbi:MAG: hypothetical protein MJE68_19520 [Proteobacteria bacterium]|nr:hypothetical protein [Pseudomonadota bacterium]